MIGTKWTTIVLRECKHGPGLMIVSDQAVVKGRLDGKPTHLEWVSRNDDGTEFENVVPWDNVARLARPLPSSETARDARRAATAAELSEEPEGVLESMARGELDVTEQTAHLAQAELDYRRQRRAGPMRGGER